MNDRMDTDGIDFLVPELERNEETPVSRDDDVGDSIGHVIADVIANEVE